MATTAATLLVKIVTDTKAAAGGLDSAGKSATSFKDRVAGASRIATAGLLAMGGAAIYAGKQAAEDAKSQALLATSMKNAAGANKEQIAATEDWIAKTALATGVADDQLRPALGTLVRATGDVALSQKAMSTALDVSAATGKDVTSVTAAMAKGYAGNTSALGRLVPGISKAALESGNMNRVMGELADKTGGSAAAAADTAAGKTQRMAVAMDEATEAIGAGLLPIIGPLATLLGKLAVFIGDNAKAFQIIAVVIASVAAAVVVLNAIIKAYTIYTTLAGIAAEHAWFAALGPIALIIAAVVAIGVALVVLYKKVGWFRDFVDAAWAIIKRGAQVAGRVFMAVWRAALQIIGALVRRYGGIFKTAWQVAVFAVKAYVGALLAYFKLAFNVIKGIVKLVVAVFKGDWRGAIDAVRGIVRAFGDFFRSLFHLLPAPVQRVAETIKNALGRAFDWLKGKASGLGDVLAKPFNAMRDAVNAVIGVVQDLIGWLDNIHIPDLSKVTGLVGKIPGLGMVAPTATGVTPGAFAAPRVGAPARRGATQNSGGVNVVVNGALDPEATARQIQRILAGHDRRVGLRTA